MIGGIQPPPRLPLDPPPSTASAAGKEKVISRTVAWMPPLVKQKGVKGYYFDFGRIYWYKPDKLPEKRSNGWEINGIPLKRRVVPEVRTVE